MDLWDHKYSDAWLPIMSLVSSVVIATTSAPLDLTSTILDRIFSTSGS